MKHHFPISRFWFVALAMALMVIGCGSSNSTYDDTYQPNPEEQLADVNLFILESEMSANLSDEGLSVRIPIHQIYKAKHEATLIVDLLSLDREKIDSNSVEIKLSDTLQEFEVVLTDLPEGFSEDDKAGYLIAFRVNNNISKLWGTRSLHVMYRYVQAQLLGTENVFEGGSTYYKLLVHEPNSGLPVEGASAAFYLADDEDKTAVGTGKTDEFGMADVRIDLPTGQFGDRKLQVMIDLPGGEQQEQAIAAINVTREAKVLLTTDKPLYQPGQTIHMRSLCLKRPDLRPQTGLPVTFFVIDAKGNKVFKEQMETSDYGVAATTFKLATLLNEGDYTIQAQVGEFFAEKTLRVERYALPKFKVEFSTDRDYYRPGDSLHGTVNADYFFGKTVAGGAVSVVASTFDVEMNTFASINGVLDDNGEFQFDIELPSYILGSALDENKGYAFFEITVTDTAGHAQIKSTSALVVESAILIATVPESGSLVPGISNTFYLITTDPFGRPLDTQCTVSTGDDSISVQTGGWGLSMFEVSPDAETLDLAIEAQTSNGETASESFSFASETQKEYVLVRTDQATYKVGDSMLISLFATNDGWDAEHLPDRIYLDVIKDGQTMLMTRVSLAEGKGTHVIDIDSTLAGTIELMAYYLGSAGEIIRDRKLVFVELSNGLTVEITPEKETFLPREDASISFKVRDAENNGVQSILGVQVVDEAVFALQEMKPGMEKIYFQLEEELLEPRYEIHGFDAADILEPQSEDPEEAERQDAYTGAFLAASGTDAAYGLNIDTYSGVAEAAMQTSTGQVTKDLQDFISHIDLLVESGFITGSEAVKDMILERNKPSNPLYDPWGRSYLLTYDGSNLTFISGGMDEKRGNADDISVSQAYYADKGDRNGWDDDVAFDGEGDWAAPGGGEQPPNQGMEDGDVPEEADPSTDHGDEGEEGDGPVVRSYFPETLYVNPSIITDSSGEADIEVTMADSITSWRMTALASSLEGQIGSNVANVIVFQDFFVDIDFPATLTQNDVVHVPIAIYNYLQVPQTISLEAEAGDWLEFLGGRTVEVNVGPNSVIGIYFPVKVVKVGWHDFTVTALGSEASDAIRRRVEVLPDGLEIRNADSGRLDGNKSVTVNIPAEAIEGASKMWVKIYPGLFSQVVEGLDSMLQMPSGCFEQTSSATYPNVLVLDYMTLTGQSTPEIEMKARDYVSQGYQRLLSYEVNGGGFEWFGETPAHRILTAYGLLEFYDMSKVHDVEDAVIERTQAWLAALQNSDGSYDVDAGGIHEGAVNNFTNSLLRTTAYISYALAESGYTGAELDKGIAWVKQNVGEATDNYTLALVAMLLGTVSPNDSTLNGVLGDLYDSRIEDEDGKIHWGQEAQTEMYGQGNSAELETTSLIAQAFIRANSHMDMVPGILDWLVSKKGSFGEWSTTQGTIQALRFMIATLGAQTETANATIVVSANGENMGTVTVTEDNSEVLQLVDLTSVLVPGANEVDLIVSGEGNVMYSVVSSYWMPSEDDPYNQDGPLSIDIAYDKTELAVNDIVTATATISNNSESNVLMVLVDIGTPPGFDILPERLNEQVQNTDLQRWELAGRQLILYIERIAAGTDMVLTYQMQARFPMEGSTGPSSAAPYYEPEEDSTAAPTHFVVADES